MSLQEKKRIQTREGGKIFKKNPKEMKSLATRYKNEMINIPNLLSIGRILCVPLFIILLLHHLYGWALFTFVIASISDALDGLLAPAEPKTLLGAYLDPAADKALNASSYTILAVMGLLPSVACGNRRQPGRHYLLRAHDPVLDFSPPEIRPSLASKLTTFFQLCTVIFALGSAYVAPVANLLSFLIWATALGTVISGLQYIARGIRIFNQ